MSGAEAAAVWRMQPAWPELPPGTPLTVVKLAPDGTEVTRYPGTVASESSTSGAGWLAVEARWVNRRIDLDGLSFVPGDRLQEYFSRVKPFNVFAVYAPSGELRGWYANVTHPTRLDVQTAPPTLTWHDLYLDVVALPDGTVALRDDDELDASGLRETDALLHAAIVAARDEALDLLAQDAVPFHRPLPEDRNSGLG